MYQEEGLLFIIHTAHRLAPLLLWAGVSGSRLWFHHNQSGKMSKIAIKRLSWDHIILFVRDNISSTISAAVFDNLCNEKYAKVESLKKYVLAFASYQPAEEKDGRNCDELRNEVSCKRDKTTDEQLN